MSKKNKGGALDIKVTYNYRLERVIRVFIINHFML
jgi:hypothetical protein